MENFGSKKPGKVNTAALLAKKHNKKKQCISNRPHIEVPTNNLPNVSQAVNAVGSALSNISLEKPKSWFGKCLAYAKSFALRVFINIFAFMCAALIFDSYPDGTERNTASIFAVYFGIICLIPRGMSVKAEWLVPTVTGAIQVFIALALKLPIPEALLWGGVQTFLQRTIMQRFNMGTEWIAGLCLVPLIFIYSPNMFSNILFFIAFMALAAFGGSYGILRSRLEARKAAVEAEKLEQEKEKAAEKIRQEKANDPFYLYTESIADLRSKLLLLPQEMQTVLIDLTKSADAIIICMREDKRDIAPGEKFLKRYLPATHSVLENYYKLSGADVSDTTSANNLQKALTESEEVLKRLALAFEQEHSVLLRNDVDDFSADLKVLDTLLKMDGR